MATGKGSRGSAGGPFDTLPTAAAVVDGRGVVIDWSDYAEHLLGYRRDEMVGRSATELLASRVDWPDDGTAAIDLEREAGWGGLVPLRARDGKRLELRIGLVPYERDAEEDDSAAADHWLVLVSSAGLPWWGPSKTLMERLFGLSPLCVGILDTDLRYVWVNRAVEQATGIPVADWPGHAPFEMTSALDDEVVAADMAEVLEYGVPVVDREYVGQSKNERPRTLAMSGSFFRLDDREGRPQALCVMFVDITERYLARRQLDLLDRASERIGSTLDVGRTAQELADVAVPDLADFVVVDLLDSVLDGGEAGAADGGTPDVDGRLLRAAHQSIREGIPEAVVAIGEEPGYPPSSPVLRALAAPEPKPWLERYFDIRDLGWEEDDPRRAAQVERYGIHSVMVVPLRARGEVLGAAALYRWRRPEPFHDDDLTLAAEFVSRAAVSVDNARRYTREHRAALTLQRSLLPQGAPDQTAVEAASRYLPADAQSGVGGDWFDIIPLSSARVALVVGDVVGHGIHAAATMGRLRTAVQTLADLDLSPEELLAHLDDMIGKLTEEESHGGPDGEPGVVGATCLYAIYDPVTRICTGARAGHPTPVTVAPDGTPDLLELPEGAPLGVGSAPFESAEFVLEEGSLLALYTNGLLRTPDADASTSLEQLRTALADPSGSLSDLCQTVVDRLVPHRPDDDVALLIARTRTLGPDKVASWDIPTDPAAVGKIRTMAARQLSEWGLEELNFTNELVVSELVTNAIRYGTAPARLRMIRDRSLITEVSDSSNTSPHLRRARMTDEGGRGLYLVSQLARRWGIRYTRNAGKTVWTEQSFTPSESAVEAGMAAAFDIDVDGADGSDGAIGADGVEAAPGDGGT